MQETRLWFTGIFLGSLSKNNKLIKYYVEPRLQFIDRKNKFEEAYIYFGPGYKILPHLILFAGLAPITTQTLSGHFSEEIRIWEQALWNIHFSKSYELIDRLRLEERNNLNRSQVSVRLRETLSSRTHLSRFEGYSFIIFDEIFLNLNKTDWIREGFFGQNRAFVGIGKLVAKHTILDVGYLNQYVTTIPNQQLSHNLSIALNIITD